MSDRDVLIVEDDVATRIVLEAVLTQSGLTLLIARNGSEAIELLERHDPAMIFVSMPSPLLAGSDFLLRLARDSRPLLKRTVVTTRSAEAAADLEGFVHAVLKKPIEIDLLADTAYNFLWGQREEHQRKPAAAAEAPVARSDQRQAS
jgi:CheY-like chemotaxis protein